MENRIFYKRKADVFEEALPLGNGAFGGMVYGNTEKEKISLNIDTLWNGKPYIEPQVDKTEHFKMAQQLHREGKRWDADRYIEEHLGRKQSCAYLPMGNLFIENDAKYEGDYTRSLDFESSIAVTEISGDKGVKYEYLFSYPHSCAAVKISSKLVSDIKISYECALNNVQDFEDGVFTVKGAAADKIVGVDSIIDAGVLDDSEKTVKFTFAASFVCDKKPTYADGKVCFEGINELIIFMTAGTTYIDWYNLCTHAECTEKTVDKLRNALKAGYDTIRQAHIKDVSELYNRTVINLVERPSDVDTVTRLKNAEGDVGLCEMLFNFAKYLTIASSRKGSQAMNLQGIWNEHNKAPWSSNYTVNINTEMNYWPTLIMGLDECYEPLVGLVKKISVTGEETAKKMYGARGFVCHHNIDLWGFTQPTVNYMGSICYSFWSVGSGWLARMLYDYYEYTLDEEYLKNVALPLMKKAAVFYLDILTEEQGKLLIYPSVSPENTYFLPGDDRKIGSAPYTCMTQSICADFFRCLVKALEITGDDDELKEKLESMIPRVEIFEIASDGRLIEFDNEYEEPEPHHRHVSHLYGLFPGEIITEGKNPEVVEAARKSLIVRGMEGTGWSMGWKTNLWAKLKDSEKAFHFVKSLLSYIEGGFDGQFREGGGVYTNLFDAHPPFQIDGNFGVASGICLMLVQKEDGIIKLLPALPEELAKKGSVSGMRLKGGITIDFAWENGKVTEVYLTAKRDTAEKICVNGESVEISLKAGKKTKAF